MSETGGCGRLCNYFIRNLAISIIAEKFDLSIHYGSYYDEIQKIVDLYSGSKVYESSIGLNEGNYFHIYNSENINYNLKSWEYFQTKEITNLLYNYLHKNKDKIINKNPFQNRYNTNNDLFIHIRLTDASRYNPGIDYYLKTINLISFDNLYISTDQKNHEIVKTIMTLYPKSSLIEYDEVNTIQFGSTNKNIILSHGSFSAVIGYLSFYSNIYYSSFDGIKSWHGDIFSINSWNKID